MNFLKFEGLEIMSIKCTVNNDHSILEINKRGVKL